MSEQILDSTIIDNGVSLYTIENLNGMKASIMNYGATLISLEVPDSKGEMRDVVLGYDTVEEYKQGGYYLGAVIGRNANRIANAACIIDGKDYKLEDNDSENNLHSGSNGFHHVIWKVEKHTVDSITLSYLSKSMEQGFPGNLKVMVTYEVTTKDELKLTYKASTDQTTVCNLTNHTYFNLNGHASGSVENQQLAIYASNYTPIIDAKSIPTGVLESVDGTPFDFRGGKRIGKEINAKIEQLQFAGGYDHNYVLDKENGVLSLAAKARALESGIGMEVYTTCPGIQFYSGNFLKKGKGKDGATYDFRQGFCLETQYFPDAINQKEFPSPILKPEETYQETTIYRFSH